MSAEEDRLENFRRAFSSHGGGCVRQCECKRKFYDWANSYDWEDGELEALQADPNATGLDYTASTIILEGKEFCMDCDCWHDRAQKIMAWIDDHGHEISEWLGLEKKRKQSIADRSPTVEGHTV